MMFSGKLVQGAVCHNRGHESVRQQAVFPVERVCQDCQHMVAIDQLTVLVHQDNAIGVAIKGDRKVRVALSDQRRQGLRLGTGIFRTRLHIDVDPVRFGVEGDHFGALLRQAARGGERLPPPVVSRIVMDALAGLSAAHGLKDPSGTALEIVHRDISPHNILVGNDGAARITDFGVAKAEVRMSSTRAGQFKGKLRIVGEPFTEEYYGVVVRKGEMAEFVAAFNDGLKAIKADGTYDEIYAKWISGDTAMAPSEGGATGASIPPAPGFPIKVGVVVPLSGDVKTFGESVRDGAAMAFEEAAALGWEIETVLADSKCDAQEAANAANKVIFEDGAKYIVGAVCSSATIPVSEIAEANQVLMISPTATNPVVTLNEDGSTKEYSYRACFLDPFQGEVVAALAQELGASKVAVLYDVGNDYVKGLAEYFKSSFEGMGGTVPVFEAYTKDDTDFSAILGKVAAAGVDTMFLPDYYNKVNLIAQQAKEKGIDATLLGGDGWDSPELRVDMVEGGYFSNHYSPADPRPIVQNFVSTYTERFGAEPDALATLAYDTAGILLQSIAEAGVDDPTAVKDAIAALEYEGISGEITFDAQHNPVKKAAVVKIENGEKIFYKFVAP